MVVAVLIKITLKAPAVLAVVVLEEDIHLLLLQLLEQQTLEVVVAALWWQRFPELARRDALITPADATRATGLILE